MRLKPGFLVPYGRAWPCCSRMAREIRELLLGNYRLIYRVMETQVYVIGFVHGARDLDALWKREERRPLQN